MKYQCKSPRCTDLDLNEEDKTCWRCGSVPVCLEGCAKTEDVLEMARQAMNEAATKLYNPNSNPSWPFLPQQQQQQPRSDSGGTDAAYLLPSYKPGSTLPIYDNKSESGRSEIRVKDWALNWEGWHSTNGGSTLMGSWKATKLGTAIAVYQNAFISLDEMSNALAANIDQVLKGVRQDEAKQKLVRLLERE